MKIFEKEGEGLQYLKTRVPPKDKEREANLAPLKEPLFEVPEKPAVGHYEFEGRGGLKISFDLVAADSAFDRCWLVYRRLLDREGADSVTGKMTPIYGIINLNIRTNNFEHKDSDGTRCLGTTWLPNLRSVDSELSHSYADVDLGYIYLIGEDGFFARPIDLAGYFHELGHIETRSPSQINAEYATYTKAEDRPERKAAYELERERDANAWMLRKTQKLFEDLGISRELIDDYVRTQLKSYHEFSRKKFLKSPEVVIE